MVGVIDSGLSHPGSGPGRGNIVLCSWARHFTPMVFLGKTFYPHGASLHPGVYMGTGKFEAGGNPAMD